MSARAVVAVSGISGPIGQDLGSQLDIDTEVEAIVGIDADDPRDPPEKLRLVRDDGKLDLSAAFREAKVTHAIYLAPDASGRVAEPARAGAADLERFLAACGAADVQTVLVSSGPFIYGAQPPPPPRTVMTYTEGSSLAPGGLRPGEADLVREAAVAKFARAHPDAAVVLVRLAHVIGKRATGLASRFLSAKKIVALQGCEPLFQFLHTEDAALAIFKLLKARRSGVYNVAPDDAVSLIEIGRALGKPVARYSPGMARAVAGWGRLFGFSGVSGLGADMVTLLQHSIVISNRKIKRDIGYAFKYASGGALTALARAAKA